MARKRTKKLDIPGGFIQVPWQLVNSNAYKALKPSTGKALPYFMGKPKQHYMDPERCTFVFEFSYKEANNNGFSNGTHHRIIADLIDKGFIDPVSKGGLRGAGLSLSRFRLSERWRKYGTNDFKKAESWNEFYQGKK